MTYQDILPVLENAGPKVTQAALASIASATEAACAKNARALWEPGVPPTLFQLQMPHFSCY